MDYNQAAETFLSCVKSRSKTEVMSRFSKYAHGEKLVLVGLYKNTGSPILPSDIAKETNMSTARVATILNNLEEKGLVTREISRTDRRKILVAITAKGREEAEQSRKEAVSLSNLMVRWDLIDFWCSTFFLKIHRTNLFTS